MRQKSGGCLGESLTRDGQIVHFICPTSEDVEEIKQVLGAKVNSIEPATTRWVGDGFERLSRYIIHPLEKEGKKLFDGFQGALKIENPPEGKWEIIVYAQDEYDFPAGRIGANSFYEFETEELAIVAWGKYKNGKRDLEREPGCKRRVRCGPFQPWFFAIGDQAVSGDLVIPSELEEYGIFQFGRKFVVHPENYWGEVPQIKTCWGIKTIDDYVSTGHYSSVKRPVKFILWHDGMFTRLGPGNPNVPQNIQPLEGSNLLAQMVLDKVKTVVSGTSDSEEVICANGDKIIIQWKPADKKKPHKGGMYWVTLQTKSGFKDEYQVEFNPNPAISTMEEYFFKVVIGKEIPTRKLEEGGSWDEVDIKDPAIREKYCFEAITKVISFRPAGRRSREYKKWAGFFPPPPQKG
ncbi:MAG TPA: hypothetical protein P5262_01965 [Candidatus Moranbacteria bacterium]|nr:hypothetical protein [Candidatus Moranbacteria bacterium]